MTSRAFEAALNAPDTDLSNVLLYKLVAAADYRGNTLAHVAEECLRAFCDPTQSHIRRRWMGLALAGMLYASPEVVKHIMTVERMLRGLGDIIIGADEREETRIVAGIVIRQALAQRIEFTSFWASDKVRNSAPNFPGDSSPSWMNEFQSFLDTLGDLALANPVTDPCILYAISLEASGGFRWASSDGALLVAIVQHGALTIILPDNLSSSIQFLEVPIAHIQSTNTRVSAPLADSQARSMQHEPWDLVLTLKHSAWTHLVNSSKCTADQITILFEAMREAKECESALKELQGAGAGIIQASNPRPDISSNSLLDTRSTRPQHIHGLISQTQLQCSTDHHNLPTKQRSQDVRRKAAIDTRRALQPNGRQAETGQSSSDQLDQISSPKIQSRRKVDSAEVSHSHKESDQVLNGSRKTTPQRIIRPGKKLIGDGVPQHKVEDSENPDNMAEDSDSAMSGINSTRALSKPTMYSKGKLPKISQAIKQRVSQPLREQSDVFDMPKEKNMTSGTGRAVGKGSDRSAQSRPRTTKPPTATNLDSARHDRKMRSKRKAEDDDEFVPTRPNAVRQGGTKRRGSIKAADAAKQTYKRSKIEPKVTDDGALSSKTALQDQDELQYDKIAKANGLKKDARLRPVFKPKETHKPASPITSLRTPLIGGLLGPQKPSQATKVAFKRPAVPPRSPHLSSTPTHHRPQPTLPATRPHTPNGMGNPPNAVVPLISSSPPLDNMAEPKSSGPRHVRTDTEILSSNSKPVPASPHAESTAISGHADQDDVDLEKVEADMQTAKLNPFTQRREGHKATSFIRRLTGDNLPEGRPDPADGSSHALSIEIGPSASSDAEELVLKAASQPLLRPQVTKRGISASITSTTVSQPAGRTTENQFAAKEVKVRKASNSETQDIGKGKRVVHKSQSLKRRQLPGVEESSHGQNKKPAKFVCHSAHLDDTAISPNEDTMAGSEHEPAREMEDSILSALQEAVEETQTEHVAEPQDDIEAEGEITLVNDDSEELPLNMKASPLRFRSSPPLPGSPSSHSSTSAEPEPSSQTPVPIAEAEEMEWEASLQPHQRALHDLLIRVSNRVLRHIVDNDTAVMDIAEGFAVDGQHLLQEVLKRHNAAYVEVWEDMETKKIAMRKELEKLIRALAKERKRINGIV